MHLKNEEEINAYHNESSPSWEGEGLTRLPQTAKQDAAKESDKVGDEEN